YFVDPETGRKFRSRNKVQRYLNNEDKPPKIKPLRLEYNTKNSVDQKMMITSPPTPFTVPNNWIIHMVPRFNSPHVYRDSLDWKMMVTSEENYYYEPGTGKKFRSLSSVQRHLAELQERFTPIGKTARRTMLHIIHQSRAFPETRVIHHHLASLQAKSIGLLVAPQGKSGMLLLTIPWFQILQSNNRATDLNSSFPLMMPGNMLR
nr:hypothetical protein [Tanacetum cinerariifolium]